MPKFEGMSPAEKAAYDRKLEIRSGLEELGVVAEGEVINADDYAITEARANQLLAENPSIPEEDALAVGYLDRMISQGRLGLEVLQRLDIEVLQRLVKDISSRAYSAEELQGMLRFIQDRIGGSPLSEVVLQWSQEREAARPRGGATEAVVDADDLVRGVGENPNELVRRAVEEREGI